MFDPRDDQCGIGLIGLGAAALRGRFGSARGWLCCSVDGRTSARRVGTRCRARRLAVLLLGICRISGWPTGEGCAGVTRKAVSEVTPWLSTQLCLAGRRHRHVVAPEL
jgi:hypothetical protein